jgi:hypothetical protein
MSSVGSNFFNELLNYEIQNTDDPNDVLQNATRAQARLGAIWRNNPKAVLLKSQKCSGMGTNGVQEPLGGPINENIDYGFNAPGTTKKYGACNLPELPFWSLSENAHKSSKKVTIDENKNNIENTKENFREGMSNEGMSNERLSNSKENMGDNNYLMIILLIVVVILIILGVCMAKTA